MPFVDRDRDRIEYLKTCYFGMTIFSNFNENVIHDLKKTFRFLRSNQQNVCSQVTRCPTLATEATFCKAQQCSNAKRVEGIKLILSFLEDNIEYFFSAFIS